MRDLLCYTPPMKRVPLWLLGSAAVSALLLDLPFPLAGPLPVWRTFFAWFALVPLLVAMIRLPASAPGARKRWLLGWSFLAGWLAGALWFGFNCYWVYGTMHVYGEMSELMAAVCLLLFSLFLGFWFGIFTLALALIRLTTREGKMHWLTLAAVPFLWTGMEFALARIPNFPWDQLGDSQVDNPLLMQTVPWAGVYGVSFLLAGVNALLAAAVVWPRVRARGFSPGVYCGSLGALLMLVAADGFLIRPPRPPVEATAVLIQPNLDVVADEVWTEAQWKNELEQFQKLGGETCKQYIKGLPETGAQLGEVECGPNPAPPALMVWPESPAPFRGLDPRFQAAMAAITQANKAPLIVGNVGMDEDEGRTRIFNSASVVTPNGEFVGRYDKIHLVPFGEYVPARRLLFFARQLTQNLEDTGRGEARKTFRIGGHRYGIFICYESVFADEVRQFTRLGAEVLVNVSDDGWYGDTSAPWQHLNMARMRAIENRRWILRDTNNGTTAAIDPYGRVRQSIPRHVADALPAEFGFSDELTFYTVHGDVFEELCAAISLLVLAWPARKLLRSWASR